MTQALQIASLFAFPLHELYNCLCLRPPFVASIDLFTFALTTLCSLERVALYHQFLMSHVTLLA
eukprot:m.118490 g.118490  ORF g.118490 m.118490 type:complete len:64 (+) comp13656_c0_seq1:1372-1563(+)